MQGAERLRSTYKEEDVRLLLTDITGLVQPLSTEEREKRIQAGVHYCEMLPVEYVPSETYQWVYQEMLKTFAKPVALAVGKTADKIIAQKGKEVVLVSLARAGIPIGILIQHYIWKKYGSSPLHYSLSIIRGRGIDHCAMQYILQRHLPGQLQFVDGWIGKGAIVQELKNALTSYPGVSSSIAVIADPAGITRLCGTHEDILIPSSCLNSTVSGLISRTFFREDIIGKHDFHGAAFYEELKAQDQSYAFIHRIEEEFCLDNDNEQEEKEKGQKIYQTGMEEAEKIAEHFGVKSIHLIKPGIGETTRVLLRRVPWKVLISPGCRNDPALMPILRLAEEKQVSIENYPMEHYKTCGIIKTMADA